MNNWFLWFNSISYVLAGGYEMGWGNSKFGVALILWGAGNTFAFLASRYT